MAFTVVTNNFVFIIEIRLLELITILHPEMSQLNHTRQGKEIVGKVRGDIANVTSVSKYEMLDGIFRILNSLQERQDKDMPSSLICSRNRISRKKLMDYLEKMQKSGLIGDLKAPAITAKGSNYLGCYAKLNRRISFIKEKYFLENSRQDLSDGDDFVQWTERG